ncbi:TolC family protein [Candidatus Sulfurimonas marisnigri]|uniref:TolC family protein n=1 Tax=Candidatus Sulfurimonas marisnigri TaxID=2740405 RepID=A0A7S7M1A2_9BACT|nr:TolC family protein [Candidatus Sulfurimonas marisnigri]QOY55163.1 TolC family protein [Candidatus Sulfurimonas marisnigri]
MLKNIIMSLLLCTFLSAESFDEFLQKAIKNSPYMESSALAVKQTKEQGNILTRYENPTLELEYSSFEPDIGSNDNGYRIGYSQPIRLWGVSEDKKNLTDANNKNADINYAQKRAIFIRDISLAYTSYSEANKLLNLSDESLSIAKKIYEISIARLESGTISQGIKLQAQVDYEMSKNSKSTLSLAAMDSYYSLLKIAGISKEIELENDYEFKINSNIENIENPTIKVLRSQQYQALSEAQLNSNTVESIDLFAEIENEPEQDVLRVGVNLPLAIFNNRSQEKTIAMLQASRIELLMKNENARLNMDFIRLKKERKALVELNVNNEKILKTQLKLLKMYEDGYKISNINLLQLQDIKHKVIQTKRALIQIYTALNQNAIYTNFYQGTYNE